MTAAPPHRRRARSLALSVGLGLVAVGCSDASPDPASAPPTSVEERVERPERLDVVAHEFGWTGLPDEVPAGTYPLSFRNDGAEPHEVFIFRNPAAVSLEEILSAGPEGAGELVEPVGKVIAGPGHVGDEIVLDLQPGTYEVVCFFPTPIDGRAHFEHGMHRALEVVA